MFLFIRVFLRKYKFQVSFYRYNIFKMQIEKKKVFPTMKFYCIIKLKKKFKYQKQQKQNSYLD